MNQHGPKHTSNYRHLCTRCGGKFMRKGLLETHLFTVHDINQVTMALQSDKSQLTSKLDENKDEEQEDQSN